MFVFHVQKNTVTLDLERGNITPNVVTTISSNTWRVNPGEPILVLWRRHGVLPQLQLLLCHHRGRHRVVPGQKPPPPPPFSGTTASQEEEDGLTAQSSYSYTMPGQAALCPRAQSHRHRARRQRRWVGEQDERDLLAATVIVVPEDLLAAADKGAVPEVTRRLSTAEQQR